MQQVIVDFITLTDSARLAHWATEKYSEHKALGKLYETMVDLTDTFVETYQGKYGRVKISTISKLEAMESTALCNAIYSAATTAETGLQKEDSDLLNILADFKSLANHTKYLLTLK